MKRCGVTKVVNFWSMVSSGQGRVAGPMEKGFRELIKRAGGVGPISMEFHSNYERDLGTSFVGVSSDAQMGGTPDYFVCGNFVAKSRKESIEAKLVKGRGNNYSWEGI